MKHINKLTFILVIAAVVFVCVLCFGATVVEQTADEEEYVSQYFDPDTVNTVKITISEENWQDMLENPLEEEYHVCSIGINGDTYDGAAIRTKGNQSLRTVASSASDRYSFKVKSDEYVKDQTFKGLSAFVLNNTIDDPTYMKEYLSYQMMKEMGVPTPLFAYAAVYINGEYYGLYLMVEAVEEDFAKRNFGADFGNLYKPDSTDMGGNNNVFAPQRTAEQGAQKDTVPRGFDREGMTNQVPGGENPAVPVPWGSDGASDASGNPWEFLPDRGVDGTAQMQFPDAEMGMRGMMPPGMEKEIPGADRGPGGNGGPGGFSGGGADLVYTDDSLSSYRTIFDNAVFSRTDTPSSNERVVTALKHLNEGTELEKYIDVDEVLRYFAAHTALVSLDSYVSNLKHNYYLYENNGKLSMIPWDYNDSFGTFMGTSASGAVNFPIDTPVSSGIELSQRPMIGSLLAVDSYKAKYHGYLKEIAEGFLGDSFPARVDKIDALIGEYVKNDPTAFYTYEQYQKSLSELKKFAALRAKSILGQLEGSIPSTWEGQKAAGAELIPTDDLDLSLLGGMGGGMGRGGGAPAQRTKGV